MIRLVSDNTTPAFVEGRRRALLAKVHLARKALGIEEDDYRALMLRVTGHRSAKDCDDRQLDAMVAEFQRMGFQATGRAPGRSRATGPVARKARAMWISLYQLGAVHDASDKALDAFARRQLRVDRLAWADERQGFRLIEALKAIAERHGWDQHLPAEVPATGHVRLLKDRLVGAQLARLMAAGTPATGPITADRAGWANTRLESAASELADRVRSIPAPP